MAAELEGLFDRTLLIIPDAAHSEHEERFRAIGKPARGRFIFVAQLTLRLPKSLLEAVKQRSSARGIPYTRFIREAVESALARPDRRG